MRSYTVRIAAAFLLIGAAGVQIGSAAEWEAPAWADTLVNTAPKDSAALATAQNLYLKNCASCHGKNGAGDGPMARTMSPRPENFQKDEDFARESDGSVFWKISQGKKPMPSWKDELSAEEIWLLVNHLRQFQPPAQESEPIQKIEEEQKMNE
jgi:mono/diheme cytochrome c family protein